jgi:hypothetical protein
LVLADHQRLAVETQHLAAFSLLLAVALAFTTTELFTTFRSLAVLALEVTAVDRGRRERCTRRVQMEPQVRVTLVAMERLLVLELLTALVVEAVLVQLAELVPPVLVALVV